MTVLQTAIDEFFVDAATVIVLAVVAGVLGAGIGLLHRWYANERVPDGLAVLVGLSGVALTLNTSGALGDIILGQRGLLALETAIFNVVTFFVAGVTAGVGGRAGDRFGASLSAVTGADAVDRDVSRIVRTVGRLTAVKVPEEVGDIVGYEPVEPTLKEKLAGQTLLFPRRLTVEELRTRFKERLRTDYGVGHVDVEFADDGSVEYLAVGRRESGIGPTLPPGSAAVALRADPPNNASPGDSVQVWTTGDAETAPRRVTNAELRGTAEDVVTLAVDEEEAKHLDPEARYRLVTLPVEPRVDREFAAQLRAAEETTGVVTVAEGSTLANSVVGSLDVAIVAIRTPGGEIEAIPTRARAFRPGETVYVIARPDGLRRLEAAAAAPGADAAPTP